MTSRVVGRTADGQPLVVVRRVGSETEGQIVQGLLRAHGVEATLVGRESAGYGAGSSALNRLRVLVLESDLDVAREVLDAPPEGEPVDVGV